MNKIGRLQLERNKEILENLKQNSKDYIVPLDWDKLKWCLVSGNDLREFLNNNYYHNNKQVSWYESFPEMEVDKDYYEIVPLGMHFLSFNPSIFKDYLIGVIPNNINKYTIIGVMEFNSDLEIVLGCEHVIDVETVEINYFYRKMGLLKEMMQAFVKNIDLSKNIIVTKETTMGRKCGVMAHLKYALYNVGYNRDIRFEDNINDLYLKSLKKIKI